MYKVTELTLEENELSITVDYLQQSTETGFVAIVYSVDSLSDSPSDLRYQVVYRENTSSTVGKLADRVYKLAVFDLNDVVKPKRKLLYPAVLPKTTLDNTQYGINESIAGTVSIITIFFLYVCMLSVKQTSSCTQSRRRGYECY